MARHLSPLTDAIKRHLINRFTHTHTSKSDIHNLPAPLKLAHVKGQAEFTLRFFGKRLFKICITNNVITILKQREE